jgi:hypothetical protein
MVDPAGTKDSGLHGAGPGRHSALIVIDNSQISVLSIGIPRHWPQNRPLHPPLCKDQLVYFGVHHWKFIITRFFENVFRVEMIC